MQRGSLAMVIRKEGPAVWQFRWSEKSLCGARIQRKRVIGSIDRYPNETAARSAVTVLLAEINSEKARIHNRSITVAQLCDHFEQRELTKDNTWRSHATKKTYQTYLNRWVRPQWRHHELAEVRTIQVESWLRCLPLAKSSCAKIRNLMSVLFNHACRYELFDRNPIHLVRQSAKRRRTPTVLIPAEIKALVDNLSIRERTLVLLAVSTGLRQSELFGLKWGDIEFSQRTMNVTRSIVYGVVGPCKTESSQKPVPVHRLVADVLLAWRKQSTYTMSDDWVFASRRHRGRHPLWGQAILRKYVPPRRWESRNALAGTRFAIRIRRCCEVWALNSRSCRSCCVTQRCDPHWMCIRRRSRRPNMQLRKPCSHWFFRMNQAEPRSRLHLLTLHHDEALRREKRAKGTPKRAPKRALLGPRWFQ